MNELLGRVRVIWNGLAAREQMLVGVAGGGLAVAIAVPGLAYLIPMGILVSVLCVGWCWQASKRIGAWRHEVLVRAHLRGERSKPSPYFRRVAHQLLFGSAVALIFLGWALMQ